jgi:alkylation response protein AidB-like acyl-CoA dehydrogenase
VADRAIQVFGGNGYMTEMGVERWARFVRAMRLYEGTSEILKTNIAKTLGLDEPAPVPAPAAAAGPAPTP